MLDGGAGSDDAIYIDSPAGVVVNLATGEGQGGDAEGDSLQNIEGVTGSRFDDIITGNGEANVIQNVIGDNIFIGRDGDDQLLSGDGDDLLIEDADLGTLDAGPGSDLLVAVASAAGTSAVLTGGDDDDLFIIATDLDGGVSLDVTATITDFDQGTDRIDLSDLRNADGAVLDLADILVDAQVANGDTVIDLANYQSSSGQQMTGTVTLTGVANPNSLIAADFVFSAGTDWEALLPTDLVV